MHFKKIDKINGIYRCKINKFEILGTWEQIWDEIITNHSKYL